MQLVVTRLSYSWDEYEPPPKKSKPENELCLGSPKAISQAVSGSVGDVSGDSNAAIVQTSGPKSGSESHSQDATTSGFSHEGVVLDVHRTGAKGPFWAPGTVFRHRRRFFTQRIFRGLPLFCSAFP